MHPYVSQNLCITFFWRTQKRCSEKCLRGFVYLQYNRSPNVVVGAPMLSSFVFLRSKSTIGLEYIMIFLFLLNYSCESLSRQETRNFQWQESIRRSKWNWPLDTLIEANFPEWKQSLQTTRRKFTHFFDWPGEYLCTVCYASISLCVFMSLRFLAPLSIPQISDALSFVLHFISMF